MGQNASYVLYRKHSCTEIWIAQLLGYGIICDKKIQTDTASLPLHMSVISHKIQRCFEFY